jgi:hypothetical protein
MARVLAVDIIAMLQAAVNEHGRELEVRGCFENEGTVELGDVYQHGDEAPRVGIFHDVIPVENAEHEALIGDMKRWRRDTMFGDGLENDYAQGSFGPDRPASNHTAEEIRHLLGDDWDDWDDDDWSSHYDWDDDDD